MLVYIEEEAIVLGGPEVAGIEEIPIENCY